MVLGQLVSERFRAVVLFVVVASWRRRSLFFDLRFFEIFVKDVRLLHGIICWKSVHCNETVEKPALRAGARRGNFSI